MTTDNKGPRARRSVFSATALSAAVIAALLPAAAFASDYTSIGSYGSQAASQPVLSLTGSDIPIGSGSLTSNAVQLGGTGNTISVSADTDLLIQNADIDGESKWSEGNATVTDRYTGRVRGWGKRSRSRGIENRGCEELCSDAGFQGNAHNQEWEIGIRRSVPQRDSREGVREHRCCQSE